MLPHLRQPSAILVAALLSSLAVVACSNSAVDTVDASASFATGADVTAMTGTISSLTGSCPAVTFLFERRTIRTDQSTLFGESGCVALKNTLRAEVSGVVLSDGSVKATRVAPIATTTATPTTPAAPATVTVTGGVHALAGVCPAITFTLEGRTVRTGATTKFGDLGCVGVVNDGRVEMTGSVNTDGSITATIVRVVVVAPTPPVTPGTSISFSGNISALSGTCPTVVITIGERRASTTAATVFNVKSCVELKVGAYAEVVGSITASTGVTMATAVTGRK